MTIVRGPHSQSQPALSTARRANRDRPLPCQPISAGLSEGCGPWGAWLWAWPGVTASGLICTRRRWQCHWRRWHPPPHPSHTQCGGWGYRASCKLWHGVYSLSIACQSWHVVFKSSRLMPSGVDLVLFQCRASVYNAGPTLKQHWLLLVL